MSESPSYYECHDCGSIGRYPAGWQLFDRMTTHCTSYAHIASWVHEGQSGSCDEEGAISHDPEVH